MASLLVLEARWVALRAWHDQVVEKNKVTDWIARSFWGSNAFTPEQEVRAFYKMFREPSGEGRKSVPLSLRAQIELRRNQQAFIARGLASRDNATRTGVYYGAGDVLDELNQGLALARAKAKQ